VLPDLSLQRSYRSGRDVLIDDFYVPAHEKRPATTGPSASFPARCITSLARPVAVSATKQPATLIANANIDVRIGCPSWEPMRVGAS
jgi:hypothetical protein